MAASGSLPSPFSTEASTSPLFSPIKSSDRVLVRVCFPEGGPELHFFVCELETEVVAQIVSVCTQLYGVPVIHPSTFRQALAGIR